MAHRGSERKQRGEREASRVTCRYLASGAAEHGGGATGQVYVRRGDERMDITESSSFWD